MTKKEQQNKQSKDMTTIQNSDNLERQIDNMEWTLYDRFVYGGLGHGYFCFPTNLIRVVMTVIFPPIGTILTHISLSNMFPYITWNTITHLFNNLDDILYSFILTACFYVPGLIYSLAKIKCQQTADQGQTMQDKERLKDVNMKEIRDHFRNIRAKSAILN